MKPSERIEEWRVFFKNNRPNETALENTLSAIVTYLDEQYEQQKPCEHKNTEDIHGIKHCLDCRLLGNF